MKITRSAYAAGKNSKQALYVATVISSDPFHCVGILSTTKERVDDQIALIIKSLSKIKGKEYTPIKDEFSTKYVEHTIEGD